MELRELPRQVAELTSQIVQLREDMHSEFSATREEFRAADETIVRSLREDIRAGDEETRSVLRGEIRAGDEETRSVLREEIRAGDEETRSVLREEIRAGDEETRSVLREEVRETQTLMRVLHEDVIGRISLLQEHSAHATPPAARQKGPRKRSR
jgi:phosphoglycerate-specific signal transduction histidine kinase